MPVVEAPPAAASPAVGAAPAHAPPGPGDHRLPGELDPESDSGPGLVGALIRTLAVLGLVVALIYVTLHFAARRLMALQPRQSPLVQIHDRFPLEPKKNLYVVEVGGEFLLLGVGEREISLVSRLDGNQVQAVLDERVARRAEAKPFWERLAVKPPVPSAPQGDDSSKA